MMKTINKKMFVGVAVLLAAAAAGIAAFAILLNIERKNPTAEIYLDGVLIRSEPLSVDAEFTIESENGVNVVKIEDGAVSIVYADCPDKVCVNMGAIRGGAVPIVCLPHKLEVRVVDGESDVDA